jgi:hypothetical protein
MYREIIQKLARENRGLRKALQAAQSTVEGVEKVLIVKDRTIREQQQDIDAANVDIKHLKLALAKVPSRISEAVGMERVEWQKTSRYNSSQIRQIRSQNDVLRQQLFKEREDKGRAYSPVRHAAHSPLRTDSTVVLEDSLAASSDPRTQNSLDASRSYDRITYREAEGVLPPLSSSSSALMSAKKTE